METTFSAEPFEHKVRSSGSASVLFLMSILGLACAAFTLAMPGAGDQMLSSACSALSCDSAAQDSASVASTSPFGAALEPAAASTSAQAQTATLQPEVAMSAADQQWQIAQSFNAQRDNAVAQPAQVAEADSDATAKNLTPLAYLADAALAMH